MGISGKYNLKKILVIGSNGFLGSTLCKSLLKFQLSEFELLQVQGKNDLDITNFELINSYLNQAKPDIVVNAAAFVGGISYGYKYPADLLHRNSLMALNIFESCRQNNINQLINPISNCAYPGELKVYKEEMFWDGKPHESVFYYALTRRLIVGLGESYFKQYNLNCTNIVMSNMYGPNDHFDEERSHALGALVKKIYDAKINNLDSITIWGTGQPIREWLYVEDAAEAIIKSFNLKSGHNFFNVGVNKGISIIDLANLIKEQLNWKGSFKFDSSKPDGASEKRVDNYRTLKLLDWQPSTRLVDGIKLTVDWYVESQK